VLIFIDIKKTTNGIEKIYIDNHKRIS
jgi:hypothetical protein